MKTALFTMIVFSATCQLLNAQDLRGRVTDEAGEAIGGALISIYTARPRVGRGVL